MRGFGCLFNHDLFFYEQYSRIDSTHVFNPCIYLTPLYLLGIMLIFDLSELPAPSAKKSIATEVGWLFLYCSHFDAHIYLKDWELTNPQIRALLGIGA